MSFITRILNMWQGFLSIWTTQIEVKNPAAVYEQAINIAISRLDTLKTNAAQVILLRNNLSKELETLEKDLKKTINQLAIVIDTNDEELALALIEHKNILEQKIQAVTTQLVSVNTTAEETKKGLIELTEQITNLRSERDTMLASKTIAETRISIQENINSVSAEPDAIALQNIRKSIETLNAQAALNAELHSVDLNTKLKNLTSKTSAKLELQELRRSKEEEKKAIQREI